MRPAMVRVENLSKRYGALVALRGLSLTVREGEALGLLGLNGAGKTTTVSILTTLLDPSGGSAFVAGHDVTREPELVKANIGLVTGENIMAEPQWSPVRYLRYFGRLSEMPRDEIAGRSRDLMNALSLTEWATVPIGKLSAGNRRKVEIARALLNQPKVLFLDEPTRELDIPSKKVVWEHLGEFHKQGTTIVLSSHDPHEIHQVCGRVAVLAKGSLQWEGPRQDLGDSSTLTNRLSELLMAGTQA